MHTASAEWYVVLHKSTTIDAAALAQAQNDAIQARINAAYTSKLGQAGYTDSQGNSYSYDPATNSGCLRLASCQHRCRRLLIRQHQPQHD